MVEVMQKINLTLTRDETKAVYEFFILWRMICDAKQKTDGIDNHKMSWQVFKCIIEQISNIFEKKLLTLRKKYRFSLTPAEAIIFNQFLLKHPISADEIWLHYLRQRIINALHVQT